MSSRNRFRIADGYELGAAMTVVGSGEAPISNASTARPDVEGPVYWMCATGITPANAAPGDLVWNAA